MITTPLTELVARPPGRVNVVVATGTFFPNLYPKKGEKQKQRRKRVITSSHTHHSPSHHQNHRSPWNSCFGASSTSKRQVLNITSIAATTVWFQDACCSAKFEDKRKVRTHRFHWQRQVDSFVSDQTDHLDQQNLVGQILLINKIHMIFFDLLIFLIFLNYEYRYYFDIFQQNIINFNFFWHFWWLILEVTLNTDSKSHIGPFWARALLGLVPIWNEHINENRDMKHRL